MGSPHWRETLYKLTHDPDEHACIPVWVQDWYGNPDVPNGTVDCSHWECAICGEELDPDDFMPDYPEPELDDGPIEDRDCDYWERHKC